MAFEGHHAPADGQSHRWALMPANRGRKPPHERVDIKFRQGTVVRDTPSAHWRWKPWPDGESAFDIVAWQPAGVLKKWKGKQENIEKGA